MNAVLSVELEILEPALVTSADHLLSLHPSQIRWVSIRLTTGGAGDGGKSVTFSAQADDDRVSVQDLVALAQKAQPHGTVVLVWYQGRSESFVI